MPSSDGSPICIKKATNLVTGRSVLGIKFQYGEISLKLGFSWENNSIEYLLPKKCIIKSGGIVIKCKEIPKIMDYVSENADIFVDMDFMYETNIVTRSGRRINKTQKTNNQILSELYHKEFIIVNTILSTLKNTIGFAEF
jgi:hypothetical protein